MASLIIAGCIHPPKTFYHSGDLGDIIYSLPTVRSLGGGTFYVGPDGCQAMLPREPMTIQRFNLIAPLLRSQPYIDQCEYFERAAGVNYNLNEFKYEMVVDGKFLDSKPGFNLARTYLHHFKLPIEADLAPWLVVPQPVPIAPVIIARSDRYHAQFDWKRILETYKGKISFVGIKSEHESFCREFGDVPFTETADLLQLAEVIAGAQLFVGNQSCPFSIAVGLGKRSILEMSSTSPNTIFNRRNIIYGCSSGTILPVIEQESQSQIDTNQVSGVTVVITNFKRADMLWSAYQSCKSAKVANIVITSSGVTPEVRNVLTLIKAEKPNVQITALAEDDGCNKAWLRGARMVTTKMMTILHDDDLILPAYERVVAGAFKTDFVHWDGSKHGPVVPGPGSYVTRPDMPEGVYPATYLLPFLLNPGTYTLSPVSGCYPTNHVISVLEECEKEFSEWAYLRPTMMVGNDLLLWLRACERFKTLHYTHDLCISYGHWSGSASFDDGSNHRMKLLPIYKRTRRHFAQNGPHIIHCVPRYNPTDQAVSKRIHDAIPSWEIGYNFEIIKQQHQWTWDRDSLSVMEPKEVPFLRDVLERAMDQCPTDDSMIMLTNDDTITTAFFWFAAWNHLKSHGAGTSFRRELNNIAQINPLIYYAPDQTPPGRDAFFFRKSWLTENLKHIPDYLLGFGDWDSTLAMLIRISEGEHPQQQEMIKPYPSSEIPNGTVWHVAHVAPWSQNKNATGMLYNRSLTNDFLKKWLGWEMPKLRGTW